MHVIGIDGRSAAGKSSLAATMAATMSAGLLHLDHLYPGWSGLLAGAETGAELVARLRAGEAASAGTWDWRLDAPGPLLTVPPTEVLIVEGVGAGVVDPDVWVWLQCDAHTRHDRAMRRGDADTFRPWWDHWARQEEGYLQVLSRGERTPDVVLDC